MAMDKRCHVKTWAEFGFTGLTCAPRVRFGGETDVLISTGSDEVYVYSTKERRLTASDWFPVDPSQTHTLITLLLQSQPHWV